MDVVAPLAPTLTGKAHCTVSDTRCRTLRPVQKSGSGVRTSDSDLMRALHDEHAHALWSYAVHLTGGDRARAEDVVQETMLRAWRHPQVLDQSQGSARAWLFTVARRIVIDDWRTSRARHEVVTAEPPEQQVADATDKSADAAVVTAALRQLSDGASAGGARVLLPRLVGRGSGATTRGTRGHREISRPLRPARIAPGAR